MAAWTAERICAHFPSLGEPAKRVIFAKIINPIVGDEVLMLSSVTEKLLLAGEVGELLGVRHPGSQLFHPYRNLTVRHQLRSLHIHGFVLPLLRPWICFSVSLCLTFPGGHAQGGHYLSARTSA